MRKKRSKELSEATEATEPAKSQKVEVKLEKDHTHAGKRYEAGEIIEVNQHDADWLTNHGTAVQN